MLELCTVLSTLIMFQEHLRYKEVHLPCNSTAIVVVAMICEGLSCLHELHANLCTLYIFLLKLGLMLIPQ